MIHMPGCPLIEPADDVITDVDQWNDVDCGRCRQPGDPVGDSLAHGAAPAAAP